jgi:hypothetical protein
VTALAQSGDGYDASWNTLDAGGGTSSGEDGYVVSGTFGQPDTDSLSAAGYELSAGFWPGAIALRGGSGAGDANCDGRLSAADVVALLLLIPAADPGPCGGGDVDRDEAVDANDLAALIDLLF